MPPSSWIFQRDWPDAASVAPRKRAARDRAMMFFMAFRASLRDPPDGHMVCEDTTMAIIRSLSEREDPLLSLKTYCGSLVSDISATPSCGTAVNFKTQKGAI